MLKYSESAEGEDAIMRHCGRCLTWLPIGSDFEKNEHLCKLCRPVGKHLATINVRDAGIHGRARGLRILDKGRKAVEGWTIRV